MIRFFTSIRLLKMGGAKACTLGPSLGDFLEDEIVRYKP